MKDDRLHRQMLRVAMLNEISSRVAHENNNLLAGILGKAELGVLASDPARMRASLQSVLASARELKIATERFVRFKKLVEDGPCRTSLVDLYRMIYGMLERAVEKAGVTVEWHVEDLPMTWCDPGAASAAMLFCLRHGLESLRTAGGGTILLEALRDDDGMMIRARANALDGTSLEEPRERSGDLTLRQAAELAESDGVVLRLGRTAGQYVIACRFPIRATPEGHEFPDVRLGEWPSRPSDGAASQIVQHHGDPPARGPRPLVALVVEDELPIRELIQEVLEGVDCQVDAEANASAALEAFGRRRFDVVFTDISMPGMDGVTLVRHLRSISPETLVVVVTGRATEDSVRAAMSAGAKLVLRKPFELSDLRMVVENIRIDPSGASLAYAARDVRNLLLS